MHDDRICIVCGRVLDFWSGDDTWRHSIGTTDPAEVDHEPIPVTREEAAQQLRPRCDFCFADYPEFVLPVRDFIFQGQGMNGDWAACRECAPLIEQNRWNTLRERTLTGFIARHPETGSDSVLAVSRDMGAMWRMMRKHICGAIRPVSNDPAHP